MKIICNLIFLTNFIYSQCDEGFTEIIDNCYFQTDLNVLQSFIDNSTNINMNWDDNENGIIEPIELGTQEWVNGRLTSLELWNNDLSGPIPEWIGNLTELTILELEHNDLSGPIPESIGNLTNLTSLSLSGNDLSGPIPESVGNLTNLTSLSLSDNNLSGPIPESVGNLINLTFLSLSGNDLSGPIPESIGNLTELTILNLERNDLSGPIPESIGNLTNLTSLYLRYNDLSGPIPESICSLSNLNYINLDNNSFCPPYPECIESTSQDLSDCELVGLECEDGYEELLPVQCLYLEDIAVLQTFIDNSTNINMNWDDNENGIIEPIELGTQEWVNGRLTSLIITHNYTNFSSTIPESIGNLTNLTVLNLSYNNLSGSIPESIGNLTELTFLDLEYNDLSGPIPESICSLSNLNYINSDNNSFCPPYPECIESTSQDLSDCELVGVECDDGYEELLPGQCLYLEDIAVLQTFIDNSTNINMNWDDNENGIIEPIEIGVQNWIDSRLTSLELWNNDLSGPIPEWIGNLTELTILDLGYNDLSGPIPESIGNLTNLTVLNLSYNNLSGSIPESIDNLAELTYLHLYGNELSGQIPESIGNLAELTYLHLGVNDLSGQIPESVGNLTELSRLDLGYNDLSGQIPESIGNLTELTILDLGANDISGQIPESIGNLTELTILDLGANDISGQIPESIDNLAELTYLHLYGNDLSGPIPESICSLSNLNINNINLGNNSFCPPYPECIESTSQDLSDCELVGVECDDGYEELLPGQCLYLEDIAVLQTFIDNSTNINMNWDDNENGIIEPIEIGVQNWIDSRLTSLDCGIPICRFSGPIPESIGNLTELTFLDLGLNDLSGPIPESIGNLTELTFLDLEYNDLSGPIPESIGNLTNLTSLSLNGNDLSGPIPESICSLSNLNYINLGQNSLCPPYPECIESTSQDLSDCELVGLECEEGYEELLPGQCFYLEDIAVLQSFIDNSNSTTINMVMDDNNNGIIEPFELGTQNWVNGKLTSLDCYFSHHYPICHLSGPIPESIGNLTELTILDLGLNDLSGPIPESIGNLAGLTSLELWNNDLSGPIPESIGNLAELTSLSLNGNELSGPIPESIGNLINLTSLRLLNNDLSGPIPESIGNLAGLTSLELWNNDLSGPIPEWIGNLTELTILDLGYNDLSGPIPESIGNLTELTYLQLYSNELSGIIPESIGNLINLTSLRLLNNNLSGPLPESIGNLTELTYLQLYSNELSGIIPESICSLSNLNFINLGNNSFCPPYPECIEPADIENQSCILGCMDPEAPNYDVNANNDDGSCIIIQTFSTGNNLISFTGVPSPSTVAELMDDYPVNFILGQGQGLFRIDDEWSGNLTNFDGYSGYWVNASESFELQYNLSNTFDACEDYPLSIGNNLVSYIGTNNQNTLTSLSGIGNYTDHINFIISQGQGLFNSNGEWSGNLTNLNNYNGYWLNLKSSWPFENDNGNKIFRWGIGEDCTEPEESSNLIKELSNIPAEFQFAQSTEQAFYLIKDIKNIENGDIITAYCGEQLVGSAIWEGEYTAIPVMGRDISEQTLGFCEPGEKPQFFWSKDQGGGIKEFGLALSPSKGDIPGFVNLGVYTIDKLESIENEILPTEWSLAPAYPNPFNPVTTIEIGVPEMVETRRPSMNSGQAVSLQVFDINGRLINTLIDGHFKPGFHSIEWDATGFPSGVYFVKMVAGDYQISQKLMLVK